MPEPPQLAERLLRWLVAGRDADAVVGDLREGFAARGGGRLWYWGQVLSCVLVRVSFYRRVLPGLGTDFHGALRRIRRNPGYALTAMVCLALAMGVNATLFSFLDSMFFRKLPVPDAGQMMQVSREGAAFCTWREYLGFRDSLSTLRAATALLFFDSADLERSSFSLNVETVSANYAQVLGLGAAAGRWFAPEDDSPASDPVVVISNQIWKTRLNRDPQVVGKQMRIFHRSWRIIGVAPADFHGVLPPFAVDAWVSFGPLSGLGAGRLNLFARRNSGATLSGAKAEMQVIGARLKAADPRNPRIAGAVQVTPISGFTRGQRKAFIPLLELLAVVCGAVMLIACVNVANLLLSRAAVRRHELALRQSLGAGRGRLFREALVEGVLLAAGAIAMGLLAGYWSGRVFELALPSVPNAIFQGIQLAIDWHAALLLAATGGASAVLFSLPCAFASSRDNVNRALRGEPGGAHARQREFYTLAQVALSLALLVATALLLRAFGRAESIDPGFATDHRLFVNLWAEPKDGKPETGIRLLNGLLEQARSLPGVVDATLAWEVFGSGSTCASESALAKPQQVRGNVVEPNYFGMMRVPVLRGRGFPNSGAPSDPLVVVVNETMARKWWPGESALGKPLWLGCQGQERKLGNVIGVARDAKYGLLDDGPQPLYYLSRRQDPGNGYFGLIIRTEGEPHLWTRPLLAVAQSAGPDVRVFEVQSVEDAIGQTLWLLKWQAALLASLGLLAVSLAAIGLYGVVAYTVSQRTREIGVRMALGAAPGDVQWMVLCHGLRITAIGVVGGLLLSAATVRLLRGFLYGLSPFDPVAFGAAGSAWVLVAMLASWHPARRATAIDPLTALKYE